MWFVESLVLLVAFVLFALSQSDADADAMLGEWPELDAFIDAFSDAETWIVYGTAALLVTGLQGVFLLPLRTPRVVGAGRRGVRCTLIVAGLGFAMLLLMAVWSLGSVIDHYAYLPGVATTAEGVIIASVLVILPAWAMATVLIARFTRPGTREDVLTTLSRRLLAGTVIEAVLLIPLDVMIRRKTDCYCAEGTFWALIWCGAIGFVSAGPAIFIPLLARRRRGWYAKHCGGCGYDMSGVEDAERCPECGMDWSGSKLPQDASRDSAAQSNR